MARRESPERYMTYLGLKIRRFLRRLPTFIAIIIVGLLSTFIYSNDNTNSTDYLKIIENIFSDNSEHITGAVVLWGKGDVPIINQLYTNYPLDNIPGFASKNDKLSEKYYLIMDLVKEIPKLEKVEVNDLNISDYHIFGANIDWENKKHSRLTQRFYSVRLFVDKNYNIFLPEKYPYHDNNSKVKGEGNRFLIFHANKKAKGLIEQILKDVES